MPHLDFDPKTACVTAAAAPAAPASDAPVTIDEIRGGTTTATNWKLVKKMKGRFEFYYACRKMTVEQAAVLTEFFTGLNDSLGNDVFEFAGGSGNTLFVDNYAVFPFRRRGENPLKPLNEFNPRTLQITAFLYFCAMFDLIYRYNASCGETYHALNCICEQNLYTCSTGENNSVLYLLPLPALLPGDYAGIAADAFDGNADVRDDLYSAAYMYINMRFMYTKDFEINVQDQRALEMIRPCLMPFAFLRPTLNDIKKNLNEKSENPTPVTTTTVATPAPAPVVDDGEPSLFEKAASWGRSIFGKSGSEERTDAIDSTNDTENGTE